MYRLEKKGGEKVGKGTYWNVSNGERVRMDRAGVLPGDASQAYLRFHPLALLVVGPLMGLVYAIFMPLVAILMVIWVLGGRILGTFADSLSRVVGVNWNRVAAQKAAVGDSSRPAAGVAPQEPLQTAAPPPQEKSGAE